MNYTKQYNLLIEKHGFQNKPLKGYYERHHIVPRSMGGCENRNNIVYVTARVHFICHLILAKIYNNSQMKCAVVMMSNMTKSMNRHIPKSHQYELIRKYNAEQAKENLTGIVRSNATKKKLSIHAKSNLNGQANIKYAYEALKGKTPYNAKKANIYDYNTNKLIAENVVIGNWCKNNGYSQSHLSLTATGKRKQHKGLYATYES